MLDAITEAATTGEENHKTPAEEIRIRTVEITTYEKAPAPVTTGTDAPGSTTATTTTTAAE